MDTSSLSPSDAIVALRSFPRRYREQLPGDDDPDRAERWSAVMTAAGAAAGVIATNAEDVRRVFVEDSPPLSTLPADHAGDPATALDRLSEAATGLADLAADHHGAEWSRPGSRSGAEVTALGLLRDAVGASADLLRSVSR